MQIEDQSVRQAVETIRNRVDALGVTEPVIQRQSTDRILVQLPGVDDPSRVKEIIGTTGLLSLTLVDDKGGPYGSQEALLQAYGGTVPPELEVVEGFNEDSESRIRTPVFYGLKRAAAVTGRDLKNARVGHDKYNQAAVEFFLNAVGAEKFGRVTGENIGKRLAIVLDRRVQSAPVINGKIESNGIIEGNFTPEKAEALTLVLRSGALPAEMIVLEERTVGPSLGLDSIKQGVLASVVGMLLVFVAMVIYYRLAGVNAVVALLLNAIFLLGAMAWINATLTLPGIAGFILTIGMAVDSNVLIFERIREEIDGGKAPRNGVDVGFKKAFGTIIDTHVTTICAAAFLFQFGTGPVKGFAVTLVIGLLASVFTAVFVSHLLFDLIYGSKEKVEAISI
jgi:preprotein translocase subunit SecD